MSVWPEPCVKLARGLILNKCYNISRRALHEPTHEEIAIKRMGFAVGNVVELLPAMRGKIPVGRRLQIASINTNGKAICVDLMTGERRGIKVSRLCLAAVRPAL